MENYGNNLNFTDSNASSGISILKDSAPQTSSSVLESKLYDLDQAITELDAVTAKLGEKLRFALRPAVDSAEKSGSNHAQEASELVYDIDRKTKRVLELRAFVSDLLDRVEI